MQETNAIAAEPRKNNRRAPWVWLLPLTAIILAMGLLYQQFSSSGQQITVVFTNAEGLEARKTLVRYKDVTVGRVEELILSSDLEHVVAVVNLNKNLDDKVRENARFWVVRPRVTITEISGLSTLVSGTFIALDPGDKGTLKNSYQALKKPPAHTTNARGKAFRLVANSVGRLDVGTPVTYKQIYVGEIVEYNLSPSGAEVEMMVFINEPYSQLVLESTRFWTSSGIKVDINANGVSAEIDTLAAMWSGGVAFETPISLDQPAAAKDNARFKLYESHAAIEAPDLGKRIYYQMNFDGSLRGLSRGAPVEFRGIRIGTVVDVKIDINPNDLSVNLPVLVAFEPGRLGLRESSDIDAKKLIENMVNRGLEAQLKTSSLLTGSLYVDLIEADGPRMITEAQPYFIFPTAQNQLDQLTRGLSSVVDQIQSMPLLEISEEVLGTIKATRALIDNEELRSAVGAASSSVEKFNNLIGSLEGQIGPITKNTDAAIIQARKALEAVEEAAEGSSNWLGDQSPIVVQTSRLLREASDAARSVRDLVEHLERNPSSVIFGDR